MTLDDLKGRCRVDEMDHWLWSGATSDGVPRVWAPDFTLHDGEMRSQTGTRAAWHVKYRKAITKGRRVFVTCGEPLCINPDHMVCEAVSRHGAKVAASGALKGNVRKIMASRAVGRRRSQLTPELIALIQSSPKTGKALSEEIGIKRQVISKVRKHGALAFTPVGGIFSGLMAANDDRRAA